MKIAHVAASDRQGGAALATWQLHQGLLDAGVESRLVVQRQTATDSNIEIIPAVDMGRHSAIVQRIYVDHNRTARSNAHFSLPHLTLDLCASESVRQADVIHLHWVGSFHISSLATSLVALEKPTVWSLQDVNPISGGCHFTSGCEGFTTDCRTCLQLSADPLQAPAALLADKQRLMQECRPHLVAPSRWMETLARRSAVCAPDHPISVIPNAVDTGSFYERDRASVRANLGFNPNTRLIFCGADHTSERRKGFTELGRALLDYQRRPPPGWENTRVLIAGEVPPDWVTSGVAYTHLGRLDYPNQLATVYAAADLFLVPSLEDNFPNMVVESQACGTPAVAFAVGGIPEAVEDRVTGRLAPPGDFSALLACAHELLTDPVQMERMSRACRARVVERHARSVVAAQHMELYRTLLREPKVPVITSPDRWHYNDILPELTLHSLSGLADQLELRCRHLDGLLAAHEAAAREPLLRRLLRRFRPPI